MAGLSMGGMQTRVITLANPDVFSYVGMFSGGSIRLKMLKMHPDLKKKSNWCSSAMAAVNLKTPGRVWRQSKGKHR